MVEVGLESRSPDACLKELVSTFLLTISQTSVLSVYCVRAAQELPAEMGPELPGWPWSHSSSSLKGAQCRGNDMGVSVGQTCVPVLTLPLSSCVTFGHTILSELHVKKRVKIAGILGCFEG